MVAEAITLAGVGPFIGAVIAALYVQYVLRVGATKALVSYRSNAYFAILTQIHGGIEDTNQYLVKKV